MARLDIDERLVKISEHRARSSRPRSWRVHEFGLSAELQQALRPTIARHLWLAALEERERERPELEAALTP